MAVTGAFSCSSSDGRSYPEVSLFLCASSLQVIWIRNTLLSGLRKTTNVDTRNIPSTYVYNYPTISALANSMTELSKSSSELPPAEVEKLKVKEMEAMASKYSDDFVLRKESVGDRAESNDVVVLLTGSTGGLGSALLAKLLLCPEVAHVYALNRHAAISLITRQTTSFEERGLDASLLRSPKLILLEGDTTSGNFGLETPTFAKVGV